MEDVTDTVYRQLLARWAPPDVFYTEFVNVDGMCSPGRDAVIHRLRHTSTEHPLVAQIWGLKPKNFERAAREIGEMGFDGIDLNMGCPVKKVIKTGACSALIDNPTLAGEMILATKQGAGDMPVSVKTRIGFKKRATLEWTAFLLEYNLAALIVHGRTTKNGAGTPADWDEIAKVVGLRDEMNIQTRIIGNGDITTPEQLENAADTYKVDGVMIGRGVLHDPLVFRNGTAAGVRDLEIPERLAMMKEHLALFRETWGNDKNVNIMKKFARTYINGFEGAGNFRNRLMSAHTYDEMFAILESSSKEW